MNQRVMLAAMIGGLLTPIAYAYYAPDVPVDEPEIDPLLVVRLYPAILEA